jgi:hypothetical protein
MSIMPLRYATTVSIALAGYTFCSLTINDAIQWVALFFVFGPSGHMTLQVSSNDSSEKSLMVWGWY